MDEDEWDEIKARISWKFQIVAPRGPTGANHILVGESISLGGKPHNRDRKEGALFCDLRKQRSPKNDKPIPMIRVIGFAIPTCSSCVAALRLYYGESS
jgi:hypothetical protein